MSIKENINQTVNENINTAIDKILKGDYVGSIYYFYDDLLAYRAYDYMYVENDDQYYLIDYRYTYDVDCKDGFVYTVKN